jgi:hypothetical protein
VRRVRADLHIHTALSPCAAAEMTPEAIVRTARERGLDMIAICDHNSAANTAAVQAAAEGTPAVLAGMEVTSGEEVHVAGLFPDARAAGDAGREVAAALPARAGRGARPLPAAAAGLGLEEVVGLIHRYGGLAVAAHVDRPSFSVFSQLGLWPEGVPFDAAELSAAGVAEDRAGRFEGLGLPLLAASDSHSLDEIGCVYTELDMEAPGFADLAAALRRPLRRGTVHA